MISLLCSSSLLLSLTPLFMMTPQCPFCFYLPLVSAGRFSVQGGKDGCWCECTFMSSFFSTRCNKAIYRELPSCGSFGAFSVSIQEGDNSCATWCWHCGSWLKNWLNTDNKVMQSETTSESSALLAVLLHNSFQQEAWHLIACHGKSGNPTDRWSPSASSSLVTLQSVHNWVKLRHITYTGRDNTFSHLEFFVWALAYLPMSLMCRYKSLKFSWT